MTPMKIGQMIKSVHDYIRSVFVAARTIRNAHKKASCPTSRPMERFRDQVTLFIYERWAEMEKKFSPDGNPTDLQVLRDEVRSWAKAKKFPDATKFSTASVMRHLGCFYGIEYDHYACKMNFSHFTGFDQGRGVHEVTSTRPPPVHAATDYYLEAKRAELEFDMGDPCRIGEYIKTLDRNVVAVIRFLGNLQKSIRDDNKVISVPVEGYQDGISKNVNSKPVQSSASQSMLIPIEYEDWREIVGHIKSDQPNIAYYLDSGTPLGMDNDTLVLGFNSGAEEYGENLKRHQAYVLRKVSELSLPHIPTRLSIKFQRHLTPSDVKAINQIREEHTRLACSAGL